MTNRLRLTLCLLAAAGCALLFAAQGKEPQNDLCVAPPGARPSLPARLLPGQGKIDMPITTKSPEAQKFFNQGVAQMHSFDGREAERSFLQAAQLDPEAPMPHWGIAMAAAGDYRPGFQLRDNGSPPTARRTPANTGRGPSGRERAREAAAKAQQLSHRGDRREQLYIAAAAARRNPESKDPGADYLRAWREVIREFPRDLEAKTYLALALMNGYTGVDKKPRPGTEEAVALLREVLEQDPDHIGAHHYVIHALEGSRRPQDAWHSSKRYPELVPGVPHALHMPGHIYVQSERWADAVNAFEQAASKESALLAADQLYPNGHHGHNVHFLTHAYCFLDKYEEAMERSGRLLQIRETPREASQPANTRTAYRQGWFARLRTLVHFRKWDAILEGSALPEYPGPRERAWRNWGRGLAFAARGQVDSGRTELAALEQQLKAWKKVAGSDSPQLQAAKLDLAGHLNLAAGRVSRGLDELERAANLELRLRYNEPPTYPRPVWEALGEAALEARQWTRAESAFRRALEQFPASPGAKRGLDAARLRGGATVTSP